MSVAIGKVIDEAWQRPSPDACKLAGIGGVIGYVSEDTTGKNITKDEVNAYVNDGIAVGVVYEYGTNQSLNGYEQGVRDATIAVGERRALGIPDARPLFLAVDFQAATDQYPAIGSYFRGAASVVSLAWTGAYGNAGIIQYLISQGLLGRNAEGIHWAWQTSAWSGGTIDAGLALYQDRYDVNIGGTLVDINEEFAHDWGGWLPTRKDEEDMFLVNVAGNPAQYLVYPDGSAKHITDETSFDALRARLGDPVPLTQADFNWLFKLVTQ